MNRLRGDVVALHLQAEPSPSPEVVELTRRVRLVVSQAHQLSTSINEMVTDLTEFGRRSRLAVASRMEDRRSATPSPYYGIERRRHA